jgi:Rieske 2Fe-2S family protein
MLLYEGVETMSLDGKRYAPMLPRLAEGQERTIYYIQLFPNLLISLHPDHVMTHRLTPLAPDNTHVECEWLFSREAVEQEDFDPSYASDFWERDQPPGLDRLRGRAEGRLLARLPPGSPLAPRGRRLPIHLDGRQRLPCRQGRTPREPRPYTINITGFSSTRLTSAM